MTVTTASVSSKMPRVCLDWIKNFAGLVTSPRNRPITNWPEIAHAFCQLGVDNPAKCFCLENYGISDFESFPPFDAPRWVHEHHPDFNLSVWQFITTQGDGFLEGLRGVIEADIIKAGQDQENGEVFATSYAKDLLEHFVRRDPSQSWVGDISSSNHTR